MSRDAEAATWFARMRGPDADQHRQAFEAWRRDPANAAAYADAERDWLIVGGIAPAHIEARTPSRPNASSAPMRWAFAAIAAVAVATGVTWHSSGGKQDVQLAERSAQRGDVALPDGSAAWLADGARVEIRYAPNERRILLSGGRGKFEVAHDAARPFIVEAGGAETVALGTIFTVEYREKGVVIELERGAVEVRAIGTASKVRLAPGQRARVENDEARIVATMRSPVGSTVIDVESASLAEIVAQANRVNALPIRLADPALAQAELTGRFDVADSASLARKLAAALGLDVDRTGDAIILSAKVKNTGG